MGEDTPREFALASAIRTYAILVAEGSMKHQLDPDVFQKKILDLSSSYYSWISGPASLLLMVQGNPINQETGNDEPWSSPLGENIMQLVDNQEVTLAVVETDSKGITLQDTLTWTIDNGSVASLVVSADTQTCTVVAGTPGSATVTVTDGTLSATLAVDVIPGTATAISITPGTPTTQPPATPTPAPTS